MTPKEWNPVTGHGDDVEWHRCELESPYRWQEPCTVRVCPDGDLFESDNGLRVPDAVKAAAEMWPDDPPSTASKIAERGRTAVMAVIARATSEAS